MSVIETGRNTETKEVIRAARIRRKLANAASAHYAKLKHTPYAQSIKRAASLEARITNLATAIILNGEIGSVETAPKGDKKISAYESRLNNLMPRVNAMVESLR